MDRETALERARDALDSIERSARSVMADHQKAGAPRRNVDSQLCLGFGVVMGAKVEYSAIKYGRETPEWRDEMTRDEWAAQAAEHIVKGDPVDVGAYMAMAWARGFSTVDVFYEIVKRITPDGTLSPRTSAPVGRSPLDQIVDSETRSEAGDGPGSTSTPDPA